MTEETLIIDKADLLKSIGSENHMFNFSKIISDFTSKQDIERITRIKDIELDKIARLYYFGIKHTIYLNQGIKFDYIHLKFSENITYSSILNYILINLSMRLSLNSKSREELRDVLRSTVDTEIKRLATEQKNKSEQNV